MCLLVVVLWRESAVGLEDGLNILEGADVGLPGGRRCVGARARGIVRVTGVVCLGADRWAGERCTEMFWETSCPFGGELTALEGKSPKR